jgi:hypothetical protein
VALRGHSGLAQIVRGKWGDKKGCFQALLSDGGAKHVFQVQDILIYYDNEMAKLYLIT